MHILLCSVVLLVPFLLIRLSQKLRPREIFFGLCSDLFLVSQVISLLCLLELFLSITWYLAFLLWALPMLSLADIWMHKNTGIRLRLSLFSHARKSRNFWESAIDMGLYKWFFVAGVWAACCLLIANSLISPLRELSQYGAGIAVLCMLSGLVALYMDRRTSPVDAYKGHNLLILEEKELVGRIFKKDINPACSASEVRKWLPAGERHLLLQDDYPLLRMTSSFFGREHYLAPYKKIRKASCNFHFFRIVSGMRHTPFRFFSTNSWASAML